MAYSYPYHLLPTDPVDADTDIWEDIPLDEPAPCSRLQTVLVSACRVLTLQPVFALVERGADRLVEQVMQTAWVQRVLTQPGALLIPMGSLSSDWYGYDNRHDLGVPPPRVVG